MSVIAKAIADRQSEIERLQGEIQALNDVDKMLVTSAPAKPAARRSSSRRPAAAATPVAETASDAKPTRKRRPMTAEEKKGGFRADDSLLGRAQKESREVARRGRGEYVPRPRSVYPSDRRSSEVVPATRRVEPSVDPARPRGPRRGRTRRPPPATA